MLEETIISSTTNECPQKSSLVMASNGSSTSRVIQSQDQQQQLKCPRCDSTNTKFCYYNNYSLSQPRHFCKACKRYWTRGGTLRNVPVGGTCRKSKKIKKPSLIMPTPNTTSAATNHISPLFYGLPTNPYISGLGFPPNQQIQDHDAVTTTISPSIVSSYPIFGSTSIRSNSTLASLIATSNNCQDLSHGEGGNEETINNCFSWSGAGPWFDPSETHSLL